MDEKQGQDVQVICSEAVEEKRKIIRHKSDFESSINALIYDGNTYPLFSQILINVVDISKNGMRFNAPCNTLLVGDKCLVQVKLKEGCKLLTAQIINIIDKNANESEYGCSLTDG